MKPKDILFRGKTINEEWVYGLLAKVGNAWYISTENGFPIGYEVIPATIGQYTGLTDKKGRTIFEGDIVESRTNESPEYWERWKVEWLDGGFKFTRDIISNRNYTYKYESNLLCENEIDIYGLVVIGNIHDHHNLI